MARRILALTTFLFVLLFLFPAVAAATLQVHFLDVGQGDCAIVLCDGEAMVIDGGPAATSQFVYSYIRNTLELDHIDLMVSTHPHLDHVYGLSAVLNAVPVDLILTPTLKWDSKAFNSMLKYAEMQGSSLAIPDEGDTLSLGSATVTILHCWPEAIDLGRTNDAFIVLRIDYGNTSFLFTGDAEDWSEYMMIDADINLNVDVLKVGHHGSYTASTMEFLEATSPEYAVISAGKGNSYGHPHQEVLENLNSVNSIVLRTDQLGTIVMESDGSSIERCPQDLLSSTTIF